RSSLAAMGKSYCRYPLNCEGETPCIALLADASAAGAAMAAWLKLGMVEAVATWLLGRDETQVNSWNRLRTWL
ncbi:hypothetical protein, partial [Mesorhizobium sp.]|uniref:hypothetical protein n=1 Tax=Mesorhizobium sp. TaxID=1871066 RepID=UPI00260118BF